MARPKKNNPEPTVQVQPTDAVAVDPTEPVQVDSSPGGEESQPNPSPETKVFERLPNGLVAGVEYPRKADGKIDWRKLVDSKYLVLRDEKKDQIEKTYDKKFSELTPNDVDDRFLLILLDGVKEVAKLRGYTALRYPNRVAQPGFVSTDCEITFVPNPDDPLGVVATDGADATEDNTDNFGRTYLTTMAINRAFVRAVRNHLGIYVVGKDEIGANGKEAAPSNVSVTMQTETKGVDGVDGFGPHAMLADILKKKGKSFEDLKSFLSKKGFEEAELSAWTSLKDIPKETVFKVVGLVNVSQKPA